MGKAGSGFKKPVRKKTFTKKDVRILVLAAIAIIAAVVILALVIRNDDFIRIKNGVLQMEDNWLISDFSKTGKTSQYYQIGEVGAIEGFTLGEESANSSMKYFWPDDEESSNVHVIYVGTAASSYSGMADYLSISTCSSAGIEVAYEPADITCAGRDAKFVYCPADPAAVAEWNAAHPADTAEAADDTAEAADDMAEAADDTAEAEAADEDAADAPAADTSGEADGETDEETPGCIIYACIDYDGERCVYIQVNTVKAVTEEEAKSLIETVGKSITLIER